MNHSSTSAKKALLLRTLSAAGVKHLSKCVVGIVFCMALLTSATCWAQFSGSLQGSVQDSTGAAVPSAVVTLTNVDTNVSQKTTADSSGVYRFASLAPGSYQLSAGATGFSGSKTALTLSTNETRNVPIVLSVGQVSASVQVTTQQPLLDTA